METTKKCNAPWRKLSDLTIIEKDIAYYGYSKEFLKKKGLFDEEKMSGFYGASHRWNIREDLEVKKINGEICFRENGGRTRPVIPEVFQTQFGPFRNHNKGEFASWLWKENVDFSIHGNFCDMFDCGEYVYAVSNLTHGMGWFSIVRIDRYLQAQIQYDNSTEECWTDFVYEGRYRNEQGFVLIFSGIKHVEDEEKDYKHRTTLFQISKEGTCCILKDWHESIAYANSMVKEGQYVYFGQNKQITRLDTETGELVYYTNKTEEELEDLAPSW